MFARHREELARIKEGSQTNELRLGDRVRVGDDETSVIGVYHNESLYRVRIVRKGMRTIYERHELTKVS